MSLKALDMGTLEHNNMIKDIGHVSVTLYVIPMFQLHKILSDALDEIKASEHAVVEQLKHLNNIVSYLQKKLQEIEHKT